MVSAKSVESTNTTIGTRETKASLIDKGVKYCLASYVDVHGIPKAKAVPVEHFDRMMNGSEIYTGAALDGMGQGPHDDELALHPDPQAVTILPWEPTVAWAPGNLQYHDKHYSMCSRSILIRQIERAKAMGFHFNLGIECEIFLVRREGDRVVPANPKSVLPKAAYDVSSLLDNLAWLSFVFGYAALLFVKAYVDLSAYTDIAIGLSALFGFRILENFYRPFFSANLFEFWRRWHISLSSWCRNQIYFPVFGWTRFPPLALFPHFLI